MKKLLLTLAILVLSCGVAFAGFDISTKNYYNETPEEATNLDANCLIPAFDLDADDDGTVDNLDANSSGDADFVTCTDFMMKDVILIDADTTLTPAANGNGVINYVSAASGTNNVTLTMPAATGTGDTYKIIWAAAPNSAAGETGDIIQVTGDDSFNGAFWMTQDSANTVVAFETSNDTDQIVFTSTQGGAAANIGIEFQDYIADKYQILWNSLIGSGTEATPGATGQRS